MQKCTIKEFSTNMPITFPKYFCANVSNGVATVLSSRLYAVLLNTLLSTTKAESIGTQFSQKNVIIEELNSSPL